MAVRAVAARPAAREQPGVWPRCGAPLSVATTTCANSRWTASLRLSEWFRLVRPSRLHRGVQVQRMVLRSFLQRHWQGADGAQPGGGARGYGEVPAGFVCEVLVRCLVDDAVLKEMHDGFDPQASSLPACTGGLGVHGSHLTRHQVVRRTAQRSSTTPTGLPFVFPCFLPAGQGPCVALVHDDCGASATVEHGLWGGRARRRRRASGCAGGCAARGRRARAACWARCWGRWWRRACTGRGRARACARWRRARRRQTSSRSCTGGTQVRAHTPATPSQLLRQVRVGWGSSCGDA